MDADLVRDVLNEVYRPAPPGSVEKGRAVLCGRCGILLVRTRRSEWRCEREECRRRGVREGKELDARDGGLRQLTRPVRQWITAPGRVALKLEQRLRAWCEVELWPDFGAFDLRLVLPGGVVWAVDVHDWVDPGLLGRLREQPRPDLAAHRRLWVVPRESVTAVSGYRTRYREVRPIGPELLSDAELVSEVKAFVENGPRGREAPDDRPQ
nr:hypothetical protein [Kitasatospora sp. SID7827]